MAYVETPFTNQTSQLYSLGWMCPRYDSADDHKIAWLTRSLAAGMTHLKGQVAYKDLDTAIAVISNQVRAASNRKLSMVQFNRLKRQIREIISTLTNLNPRWEYETYNEDLEEQAEILNKRRDNWWTTSFVDRRIKEALQWAVLGAGYLSPTWGKSPFGSEQADVTTRAFGMTQVLQDQPSRDGDLQRAYAVHIQDTMSIAAASAAFPEAASLGKIIPDRVMNSVAPGPMKLISTWAAPIFKYLGLGGGAVDSSMNDVNSPFPEVDVYYTYVADMSVNDSGALLHSEDISRGYAQSLTRGTMWEYGIPSLGTEIPDGTLTLAAAGSDYGPNGEMLGSGGQQLTPNTRPTTREDCLLYPLRRLIVWTNHCVLYDGPSPWWHGKVPLVKFTFDKWPWQSLGFNIVGENYSIQAAGDSLARGAVDSLELRLDPPLTFNENEYSRQAMEVLNTRVPGERLAQTGMINDPVKPLLDWQSYELPQQWLPVYEKFQSDMDYQIGVQDFTALAKLQQVPSAESIDRLLQAAGPLISDFARDMERSLTDLGYMFMWLILEFDTTARRLSTLGRDGVTKEDFDFKPGSLIPDQVPGLPEDAPLMRKGLLHGRQFVFNITPRSSFNVTDIQNKLFLLQLWRDPKNFPISPWDLAKAWNLPNFGEAPPETTNMVERYIAWQEMQMKYTVMLQAQAQAMMAQAQMQIMQSMGPEAMIQQGLAGMMQQGQQGGPPGAQNGTGRPEGRPPSGQAMPEIQQKADLSGTGPRSVVSES